MERAFNLFADRESARADEQWPPFIDREVFGAGYIAGRDSLADRLLEADEIEKAQSAYLEAAERTVEQLREALRTITQNIERDGYASPALLAILLIARAALKAQGPP